MLNIVRSLAVLCIPPEKIFEFTCGFNFEQKQVLHHECCVLKWEIVEGDATKKMDGTYQRTFDHIDRAGFAMEATDLWPVHTPIVDFQWTVAYY